MCGGLCVKRVAIAAGEDGSDAQLTGSQRGQSDGSDA